MDNFETYLYIILAAIYIISRIIKARSKQGQQKPPIRPQQPAQTATTARQQQRKKPFSFEDILKEFEKNLAGEQMVEEEPVFPVEEIKYEKPKPVPTKPIQEKPSPYTTYEGTSYETFDIQADREKGEVFSRSEKYSIKRDIASEYVKMLQDPEGFKNAIVLSEIINRKYF